MRAPSDRPHLTMRAPGNRHDRKKMLILPPKKLAFSFTVCYITVLHQKKGTQKMRTTLILTETLAFLQTASFGVPEFGDNHAMTTQSSFAKASVDRSRQGFGGQINQSFKLKD